MGREEDTDIIFLIFKGCLRKFLFPRIVKTRYKSVNAIPNDEF